jgi:ribose-phosphate pyrophosphokinase
MIKLNGRILDFKSFPNGETKVDNEQLVKYMSGINQIMFKYENDSDLLKLMFVKRFLDSYNKRSFLIIVYMPYSRMDRQEGMTAFTLKYISEFINQLDFEKVTIVEPHSDVTAALINKSYAIYPTIDLLEDVVKQVGFNKETDYLMFPDAGAQKRYNQIKDYKTVVGFKHRNFKTGKIESLEIVGNSNLQGKKVIILDDLCSYGGTFMLSGKKLKELGAAKIYLLVAHAEYAVFEGDVFKHDIINKVFTTNSIIDEDVERHLFENSKEKIHIYNVL